MLKALRTYTLFPTNCSRTSHRTSNRSSSRALIPPLRETAYAVRNCRILPFTLACRAFFTFGLIFQNFAATSDRTIFL